MHYCTSNPDWRRVLVALLLWSGISVACAGGIAVDKAELRAGEGSYRVVADFVITPNAMVEQALMHGIPLYFVSEFTFVRPRWYWLNETVAQDDQTVKLSYNALTRQYRVSYGALFQNFSNLDDALLVLGHQVFAPFSASLLKQGARYSVTVRMHLDPTQLPKPLQINALVNTDWELDSGGYRWAASTDELRGAQGKKGNP